MSQEVFFRGLFSGVMSLIFAWVVFSRQDEEQTGITEFHIQRYRPYISGSLLPMFFLILLLFGTVSFGVERAFRMTLSSCFEIFLSICLYYPVLLLILPVLRRHISARACAMLWLIPNYLYILIQSHMQLPSPLFVIPLKDFWVWVLFCVWFAGFTGVLLFKFSEHIHFRRQLLADAHPVTDRNILQNWDKQLTEANFRKPKFQLMVSPTAATPLTIGLFKRSTRVVLPDRTYSDEELELILRHELIHIGREDAWSKFFMVFCTAMCWFNPFMWIAMRKAADDTELSCDETVLLNTDNAGRKQYALLLLNTAGDERGFTTCLSATANAMRYRLRSVTKPGARHSGALIVGAAFFILAMTSGYVALACGGNSGAEILYHSGDLSAYSVESISLEGDEFRTHYAVLDEPALHEYLAGLSLYEMTGNYSYSDSEKCFTYFISGPGGRDFIELHDHILQLVHLRGRDSVTESYYIPEGLNWDCIDRIIVPYPACNVQLYEENDQYGEKLSAHVDQLRKLEDGKWVLLQEDILPEGEHHGIFGYAPRSAVFFFSQELAAPFSVLVESWDYRESYTVCPENSTMSLPEYPAHYTVFASFRYPDGTLYESEFSFDIGEIGSA